MTVTDAADALAMSEKYLRRLIEAKQVRCVRLGRAVRLRRSDVEDLIEANTVDTVDWARELEPRR